MKSLLLLLSFLALFGTGFAQETDLPLASFEKPVADYFTNGTLFSGENIRVSNVFPNPVSTQAAIDYTLTDPQAEASIVIHNLLGNKVAETPLEKGSTNVRIPTDMLDNGIYFYSLYVNGKRVATKKMLVKK